MAANVSLFIASPLIAPIAMLGWGASLGGLIGVAVGAEKHAAKKDGTLSALIHDAIASGQTVLLAETQTKQESAVSREVIQALVADYKDISTVLAR